MRQRKTKAFAVTGTQHGSIVIGGRAKAARRAFRKYYNGERVISCRPTSMMWVW